MAQDVSSEPFLQIFEARYDVIEDRMADIFLAGYGRLWLPPPARADSGGLSVGYDVFDRFDLGSPGNETLYGTELGLKNVIRTANRAGVKVNTDLILNHNGFSDNNTFDPSTGVSFVESGGYPGFLSEAPGLPFGDFHPPADVNLDPLTGRLSGLNDINQSLNLQFIRSPVDAGDPQNIPAGASGIFNRLPANAPDPNNARFYPDTDLGATVVFDPRLNQDVTLRSFNLSDPLRGDAVPENALGLMLRNVRWMIEQIGVDGFRLDAARHFHGRDPSQQFVLDFFDHAAFLAGNKTLLDGSPDHQFSFIETGGDGDNSYLNSFIRKDIDSGNLGMLGGNRDNLDFNLFFALRDNLQQNGLVNDWRNVKNTSIDAQDDGFANNGSQGVSFARSHDDGPAFLDNVAHAYLLLRPGNTNLYFNAKQFGEGRPFPEDGRGDALGGLFGDTVTTLVGIRNSHGRGDYLDRTPTADEKELLIYERESSALVVLNNRGDSGFDERTVQTSFAPGTPLVELTGNADNSFIDPNDDLPSVVTVGAGGQVTVRSPRNLSTVAGTGQVNEHRSGYLIYGVARPEGELLLTDASGQEITDAIAGSTPTAGQGGPGGPSDNFFNGTTRLADITVVTEDSFKLRIETDAVTLPGGVRDVDADGDAALFRINGGIDANGNGVVDNVTPGDVAYAFESFTDVNAPGFGSGQLPDGGGDGLFEQTIDTTGLAEGRHFLTGRVFRHRDAATGGDGGPAVFTDLRRVIYVDRLPPDVELAGFEPIEGNPNGRNLIIRSTDDTAESSHFFLSVSAEVSDEELLARALNGEGFGDVYDADSFNATFTNLPSGNHAVSVVTIEPSGNFSVERFAGLTLDGTRGIGVGDLDFNNAFTVADISGPRGIEDALEDADETFNPAADANADGLTDVRDLLGLGQFLLDGGADSAVLDEYSDALLRRADLNDDGTNDADDLALLYDNSGSSDSLFDLNLDGTIDAADARVLITGLVRTVPGDINLDGFVDAADFIAYREAEATQALFADADFDGDVDAADFDVWAAALGYARGDFGVSAPMSSALGVGAQSLSSPPAVTPEPTSAVLFLLTGLFWRRLGRRRADPQGEVVPLADLYDSSESS